MTTASPTPFAASQSLQHGRAPRMRPPTRSLSSRVANPPPRRPYSPLSSLGQSQGFSADAPALQNITIDSSDDDMPPPMKFSALTRAILEDEQPNKSRSPSSQAQYPFQSRERADPARKQPDLRKPEPSREDLARADTPPRGPMRIRRTPPPADAGAGSPPRVVHLSASKSSGGLRRSPSASEVRVRGERSASRSRERTPLELITPAPRPLGKWGSRSQAESGANSSATHSSKSHASAQAVSGNLSDAAESNLADLEGAPDHFAGNDIEGSHYLNRTRPAGEVVSSSMRVKRVPNFSGSFMRGAPMRRAPRRHNSEENQSPQEEAMVDAPNDAADGSREHNNDEKMAEHVEAHDFASARPQSRHEHRQPSSSRREEPYALRSSVDRSTRRPLSSEGQQQSQSRSRANSQAQPIFKIPSLPPMSVSSDQENDPPPTFKRNKQQPSGLLDRAEKPHIEIDSKPGTMLAETPRSPRPALAQISNNTPRRAAPPPPKMSVLETATANGGASTVKSKKKRSHVLVNGKMFTLRGRLGKGGSSDVYRVMAENDKMFALKKVNLEDCNEDTVRGYKGEIDLLKKLEECDRVIRLFDWEVNEQKQTLSVLMEMGESDLNRIISHRLHPDDAKLDLSFTRYYWREMLECVAAVHNYDIVHSDLKPANFLLVQGRLKLIDFGIANAIDIDNTVNVHRETNVGTPNYMSPESLQDTNAGERGSGAPKLMKLGKPSDVWSLGCILYQMTYGKPPFAHIANQWNRVMAIINPQVQISYPDKGVGGVQVPMSLKRLLKRCLNRDFTQRPTLAQLLDEKESFLNPDAELDGAVPMTEDLLGQILLKVVERCRDPRRGIPTDAELRTYPKGFLDRIRTMMEKS